MDHVTTMPTTDEPRRFDDVAPTRRHAPMIVDSSEMTSSDSASSYRFDMRDALVMPLWLPYVCLTIVILTLLLASFVRFHIQRGFQYVERSQVSTDNVSSSSAENKKHSFVQPCQSTGSRAPLAVNIGTCTPSVSSTPELRHLSVAPPVEFSSLHPAFKANGNRSLQSVGELKDFGSVAAAAMLAKRKHRNSAEPEVVRPRQLVRSLLGTRQFAFNVNGSMVDIRCIDDERTNTFRLAGDTSRDSISTLVVMTTSFEDHGMAGGDDERLTFDSDAAKTESAVGGGNGWNLDRTHRPHSTHERFQHDVSGERARILFGRPASTGLLRGEIWRNTDSMTIGPGIKPKLHLSRPADY